MKPLFRTIASTVLLCALGAGAGLVGAKVLAAWKPDYIRGDYSAMQAQAGESVVVLGTQWCGFCAKTREYLNAQGIRFADIDIEVSEEAAGWLDQLGAPGVPVVLIGDRQIRGFRPEAMLDAVSALPRGEG